jgi:hypothetical protein
MRFVTFYIELNTFYIVSSLIERTDSVFFGEVEMFMYYLDDIKLVTKVSAYSQDFTSNWLTKHHVKCFFT